VTNPGIEGIQLNFNNAPVGVDTSDILFWIFTENATMSDTDGNLIFYTNGCEIANKNHELMMNGDSLNPGEFHDFLCETGYSGGPQSALVLPIPNQENEYILFHQAAKFDPNFTIYTDKLYYSRIDMDLDDGLGGVIEKNSLLIEDTLRSGELTAVKHSNGMDWWLINGRLATDSFFTFLITENTIEGPFFQEIGLPDTRSGRASGQVCFSPNGEKFVHYNKKDHLFLYDFDRSTGLLSNFEQIIVDDTIQSGGCAFSSNSQFLYVSTGGRLFQFDVTSDDVKESQVFIDEYDGFMSPFATTLYQMQLAPDCRIFMNSINTVDVLHVINHPNRKGLACDFQQHSFQLPYNHRRSIPHFPNYRLDTGFPTCDSSLAVNNVNVFVPKWEEVSVFPNPTSIDLNLSFSIVPRNDLKVRFFNLLGQEVAVFSISAGQQMVELSLIELPKGMYLLQVLEEGRLVATKKVQIIQ